MQSLKNIFIRLFGIDVRSLAVTRIALGLILLFNLIIQFSDISSLLTDNGIAARVRVFEYWPDILSIHAISGSLWFQAILLSIQIIAAIFLIFGYKTKLMTVISWVLLVSINTRMQLVLNGGDVLFRMLLFWGMFVPWGSYLSIDYLKSRIPVDRVSISIGGIGLLIQASFVYIFTGLLKTGAEWTHDFTAIYFTLSNSQFATNFGEWLLNFPTFLQALTPTILCLEIVGGILLFFPIFTKQIRIVLFFLFTFLQIGINLSMDNLFIFGVVSIVSIIPFLPGTFWDAIIKYFRKKKVSKKTTIYYDDDCSFCLKAVGLIRSILLLSNSVKIKKASTSDVAKKIMKKENSWVVINKHGEFIRYDALMQIMKISPFHFLVPFLSIKLFKNIGDSVYKKIVKSRTHVCVVEKESRWRAYTIFLRDITALGVLAYVILANVDSLNRWEKIVPKPVHVVAYQFQLQQGFAMFAPYPTKSDGWYIVRGVHVDGSVQDFFTGSEDIIPSTFSYNPPEDKSNVFENGRWWRYFANLKKDKYEYFREPYLKYICREWNAVNEKKLESVEMIYMFEKTPAPDEVRKIPSIRSLAKYECKK